MTKIQKMHIDEIDIDTNMVSQLLKDHCSHLAPLPIYPVASYGTDHALFRLGSEYVVRLPRRESAIDSLQNECSVLAVIVPHISYPISTPIFLGSKTAYYPFPWAIFSWIPGNNPAGEIGDEYHDLAIDLANFLNQLHQVPRGNIKPSRRGVSFFEQDQDVCQALDAMGDYLPLNEDIWILWQGFCDDLPDWENAPLLIHGDLLPGNVLIKENRLAGVIDWSDVGVGDPAVDCIIAWAIFNKRSRTIFKKQLNVDDDTWRRGKAWAVSISLIGLAYYKDTNPQFCAVLNRMLSNVLQDSSI